MTGRRWRGIFLKKCPASAELRELANTFLNDMNLWQSLIGFCQVFFSARIAAQSRPLGGLRPLLAYSMQIDYGSR